MSSLWIFEIEQGSGESQTFHGRKLVMGSITPEQCHLVPPVYNHGLMKHSLVVS
jgi:hypothetical protein